MPKHFIKVDQTYQPKNKLQKAIYEALNKEDSTLLEHKKLETFITEKQQEVNDLNAQFPRCKAEALRTYNYDEHTRIYIDGLIMISAYTVKINA